MSPLFQNEALTAKCRCMMGRLLTKEQYLELAGQPGLAEAVIYLREETAYAPVFASVDPNRVHRARLEQLLEASLLDAYVKLYTFTSGNERRFIGQLLREFEIRCLLDAIRASGDEFCAIPPFIREHSSVDFTRIAGGGSMEEKLRGLEGSGYDDILRPVMGGENVRLSDIEAILWRSYYKRLCTKYAGLFDGVQRQHILQAVHTRIDLFNMSVILRLRRFEALRSGSERTSLDIAAVVPMLIPIFGRLKESDIADICADELNLSETIDRFAGILRCEAGMLSERNAAGSYGSRLLYARSRRYAASFGASFDTALGCLSLIRFETDNLIYILEALRYGLPAERIAQNIIS